MPEPVVFSEIESSILTCDYWHVAVTAKVHEFFYLWFISCHASVVPDPYCPDVYDVEEHFIPVSAHRYLRDAVYRLADSSSAYLPPRS